MHPHLVATRRREVWLPLRPSGPAPLCGGEPRIGVRRDSCLLQRNAKAWRTVQPLPQPKRKKAPSRGARRPYEAQTNPPPVWKMDQARALTRCLAKEAPPITRRTRIARPISQMGNPGDLSKASPAACFFASFFAPKKEVRDCQGAHSPLIQFRGAPAGRCYTLRQYAAATWGLPLSHLR